MATCLVTVSPNFAWSHLCNERRPCRNHVIGVSLETGSLTIPARDQLRRTMDETGVETTVGSRLR